MEKITATMEEVFKTKMSWNERQRLIEAAFPSTTTLSWEKAFKNDSALFGEVLRGILKYDQARKGKPGPRPVANKEDSQARLSQFMGEDYALDTIDIALRDLKGSLSMRGLAAKTGVTANKLWRILHRKYFPDIITVEQIAKAFNKHPSYFLEYRMQYIVSALVHRMTEWPESSVVTYRKLKGGEY